MRLYIVRHGIAVDRDDPDCPSESERFLTERGRKKTGRVAEGLKRWGISADAFLTSPYLRARQTAEITARILSFPIKRIHETAALLPNAPPSQIFKELKRYSHAQVICFGHAPHIDRMLAIAVEAAAPLTKMKKSGVAALEMEALEPAHGELLWLVAPKLFQ